MSHDLPGRLAAQSSLPSAIVAGWVERLGAGSPETLERLHAGYQVVYRLRDVDRGSGGERAARPVLLRVSAAREEAELVAASDYLRHLHGAGAPVCAPLRFASGRWVERVSHDGVTYGLTRVAWVPGEPIGRSCHDAGTFRAWGRAMARLHAAAVGYRPAAALHFLAWRDQLDAIRTRVDAGEAAEREELRQLEGWLAGRAETGPRFGLTHGDMNAGNAIRDGAAITFIDFEEPYWHWFAADVARPLRELPRDAALVAALRDALVAGYREVRPFDDDEVADLAWLVRFKNLEIHTWRRAALGADPTSAESRALREAVARPLLLDG